MHILVVDDDVRILRFLRSSLTLAGYDITTTTSGEEAIRLMESDEPDIMLLDILMPVIDGFEVLRRLRSYSDLPVIVFSANEYASEETLRLGADYFVVKPFIPDELVTIIKKVIAQRGEQAD
jgi:two-component system KDP operon response regulator KdpE